MKLSLLWSVASRWLLLLNTFRLFFLLLLLLLLLLLWKSCSLMERLMWGKSELSRLLDRVEKLRGGLASVRGEDILLLRGGGWKE